MKEHHKITIEDARREIEAMGDTIKKAPGAKDCPEWQWPLFETAEWLGWRPRKEGISAQEIKKTAFAFGQRVRMGGVLRSLEIAVEVFNRWVEGDRDTPGQKFAEALIDEALTSDS